MEEIEILCNKCFGKLPVVYATATMGLDGGDIKTTKRSFIVKPCPCISLDDKTIEEAIEIIGRAGRLVEDEWSDYEYASDCNDLIQRLKKYKENKLS